MKNKIAIVSLTLTICLNLTAQEAMEEIPYATIPDAPDTYTAGTVVSRMIDGLGFRYYWATEGLTEKDYNYKPNDDGRSIAETLVHLYGLSNTIVNSAQKVPNDGTIKKETPAIASLRKLTLENLKTASVIFKAATELSDYTLVFKNASGSNEYPFWNHINGPIEDAVWHAGQVVLLRRSAGNPINPKVSVFLGKLKD